MAITQCYNPRCKCTFPQVVPLSKEESKLFRVVLVNKAGKVYFCSRSCYEQYHMMVSGTKSLSLQSYCSTDRNQVQGWRSLPPTESNIVIEVTDE